MLDEFRKVDSEFHYLNDYMWIWEKGAELKDLSDIRNHFAYIPTTE